MSGPRPGRRPGAARALLLVALAACAGCASVRGWLPGGVPEELEPEKVPAALATAREDLARGDNQRALEWLQAASRARGLDPALRDEVQRTLEEAAARRIEELSAPDQDPGELADMLELGLPRQIAVTASIRAAGILRDRGEPMEAFELIEKVDRKFPLHHERVAAGDLLAAIGLELAQDEPTFFGFFDTRGEAQEVLEYLILHAPWCARSDEAYETLADIYAQDGEWRLAIERLEQLVLNHPNSPRVPAARLRIPEVRLSSHKSPEYDRSELDRARRELEAWLRDYPRSENERAARILLADALLRLADSDLVIAGFYRRVDNPYGARMHATRAIAEAEAAGDASRVERARAMLAALPERAAPVEEARP